MTLQNPIALVRGLGSSGSGLHHWRSQRYSALLLLPLTVWLLVMGTSLADTDYASAVAILSHQFHAGMIIMLAGTLFFHMQLGLQVVIEDYVHIPALEVGLLLMVRALCLAAFVISVLAALKLVMGT